MFEDQGRCLTTADIGKMIRAKRRANSLTQIEFAAMCGVGVRFVSELENGKPSVEMSKVLQVLQGLGMELFIKSRGWQEA